ncbi:class I SAM-dependent methyltransferase [Rhodocytophaga rosea]|nr:class I SAM-dependent methyltransferase [Rhodocytophaga rosea]
MQKIIQRLLPKSIKKELITYGKEKAFAGNNVSCPCCNKNYITFLPAGVKKRPNAICPGCHSFERHRLLWMYLTNKTNLFKDKIKVLHVAPEPLFFKKFKSYSNIDYVPCAKFGEGYEDAYPTGTIDIDITDIKLEDNTFDVILCSHVLEHIPDDIKAMSELRRVLKESGWAILQVPLDTSREHTYEDFSIISPEDREKAFGQRDHVRLYGKDYAERLEKAGFKVKKDKYVDTFTENEIFKYGFIKEDIYFCTKK